MDQIRRNTPGPEETAAFKRRMSAKTEDDIRRHMEQDGYDPDEHIDEENIIFPVVIRRRLGMSQRQFAEAIDGPLATLQNWEQHRTSMDPATISLMMILAREPEVALQALQRNPAGRIRRSA